MEETITGALEERGPLTGAALREVCRGEGFDLWRSCMLSDRVLVRRIGRRYLRLDRRVEGFARLSPSILREFLTYCVVGLEEQSPSIERRADDLAEHIAQVSAAKLRLGRRIVDELGTRVRASLGDAAEGYCVLLAGDIVYGMGHDAPRSESSTGQMVKGSDIDLVVITEDAAPSELGEALDAAIYQEKYRLLNNPAFREEIDYVVKPLSRVREQAKFDTFKHMVSCKILKEAKLISGKEDLHKRAVGLLDEGGIGEKLAAMEAEATEARRRAEMHLLRRDEGGLSGEDLYLFHTSEETEEFE